MATSVDRNAANPSNSDHTLRWIALVIAVSAFVARVWMAWTTHSTFEDALITLRYSENIAAGHGFVYNPGERVLGTTTPLYTLLLAFVAWLHLDPLLVGKACNILADSTTCYLLARLLARPEIGQPLAGLFAALLYAFSNTSLDISIAGMETGLVTCVGMAAIWAYVARRTLSLYLWSAVLFLLRIDGLTLIGLLAIGEMGRERRLPWREIGLALLLVLPWLLFAFVYFGSPIPTSLIAKATVYPRILPLYYNLPQFRTQFLGPPAPSLSMDAALSASFFDGCQRMITIQRTLTLLFVVGAIGIFRSRQRAALGAPLLWLLIYYSTMLKVQIPAFPWYFLPPWPLFLGFAALGAEQIAGQLATWLAHALPAIPRMRLRRAWPLALLAAGMIGVRHLRTVRGPIVATQWQEETLRVPIGRWFQEHARPNERILLEPIGYVGYYAQRPILDMVGLVSPEVLSSYRHAANPLTDILHRLSPEWLCLRPNEIAALDAAGQEILATQYRYEREFHVPGRPPDFLIYHRRLLAARPRIQPQAGPPSTAGFRALCRAMKPTPFPQSQIERSTSITKEYPG